MIKATYLLISWNHGNIFLKPMQNFIIYFSHFSFSAISQACFHIRWKLVYYIIIPYHKPYLIWRKNVMDKFLNSYGIIHSFVVFLTVNWFLILFSSVEHFLITKTEIWQRKVKHSWINMFPVHLYFLNMRPCHFIQD